MIRFIKEHFFDRKKTWTLLVSLGFISILCALLIYPYDGYINYIIEQTIHQLMGKEMILNMMHLIYPFVVILLVMDHDQPYLRPLMAYFGRDRILYAKIGFYLILNFIFLMTLWMMIHLITYFMTYYHFLHDLMIEDFIDLYLDGVIIFIYILTMIRDKHKNFAILFGILHLMIHFIQEDQKFLWLYYVIPFKKQVFMHFFLVTPYKICYIIIGFLISYRRHQMEALT